MINTTPQSLYEHDFVAWCEDAIAKLKAGRLHEINVDNLIEELEGLAARDRRELESRLEVLLNHLLKRIYIDSPDDYRGWELTIREQRRQLQRLLKQSPSLRNHWQQTFPELWAVALSDVKEDYPKSAFPDEWQMSQDIEMLLNQKFW